MSTAKRRRDALRRKGCEPFATLRCDDLLSAACSLNSAELRLWLLLHAAWKPTQSGAKAGETFVSYSQAVEMAGHGRSTIAAAFRGLEARGLIVLRREGSRPRGQGAAAGEAAVWDLPSRHRGERPAPPLSDGVERPYGRVRLNAFRIRADIRHLSPAETKVLAFAIAHRHRTKDGDLVENVPFALSTRRLAHALGLSGSCVAEATAALARKGRLLPVEKSVGRRPATYKLGSPYTKHEKHGGKTAASPKLDFGHQAA